MESREVVLLRGVWGIVCGPECRVVDNGARRPLVKLIYETPSGKERRPSLQREYSEPELPAAERSCRSDIWRRSRLKGCSASVGKVDSRGA